MAAFDGLTGIVFGAIFASVFVFTCIISAIKALRDRSCIKKRRAIRKRNQLENSCENGKKNSIEEEGIQLQSPSTSGANQPPKSCNDMFANGTSGQDDITGRIDLSVYAPDAGVDNLTFQISDTSIKCTNENTYLLQQKSKPENKIAIFKESRVPRRAKPHDANYRLKRNLDHHSADCLAIKKIMRRHSYEIAVCENSWLPKVAPSFLPSKMTLNAFRYVGNVASDTKVSEVAFENEIFNKNDYENT